VSRFVIDASVVLAWCFPDENSPYAQRIAQMFGLGDSAIAPAFWPHEVLNALLVGEKRKRIAHPLLETFLTDLATLPIKLQQSLLTMFLVQPPLWSDRL
jgi:predicted nucleic acid-binding protein